MQKYFKISRLSKLVPTSAKYVILKAESFLEVDIYNLKISPTCPLSGQRAILDHSGTLQSLRPSLTDTLLYHLKIS